MKNKNLILVGILLSLLILPLVFAHLGEEIERIHDDVEDSGGKSTVGLPENLEKVADYNKEQAQFYLRNLSFIIAFLAGILAILTPCSLAILPAFFAYSFKEKKQLTKMTFIFFLGFMPIFVIFGLIASFLGQTIAMFQQNSRIFVTIAGFFIIFFGLMTLFGKGFSFLKIKRKTSKSSLGTFLFGIFFALGFTACLGPILVGILLIAGILQNYFYASVLMLFYSLGLFVPLFFISFFFDKYNLSNFINQINKRVGFPITSLIAGLLLIGIGLTFIIYGGTFITNYLGLGELTVFIYSIQNKIVSLKFINIIGIIILAGFLYLLWRFLGGKGVEKKKVKNAFGKSIF